MKYPTLALGFAKQFLKIKLVEGGAITDVTEYVSYQGEGGDIESSLMDLVVALEEMPNLVSAGSKFDSLARPIIHSHLIQLPEEVRANPDFWRYLSTIRFFEFVRTRHPETQKSKAFDANWANFGGRSQSISESLIFRLFRGAELSYDGENRNDPYHLAKVHDVDLWQSHIIRVLSGENPIYARELIRWFNNRDEWYRNGLSKRNVEKEIEKYRNFKIDHLRDTVKRVRRIHSNVLHEFLTPEEVGRLIREEAKISFEERDSWSKLASKQR